MHLDRGFHRARRLDYPWSPFRQHKPGLTFSALQGIQGQPSARRELALPHFDVAHPCKFSDLQKPVINFRC